MPIGMDRHTGRAISGQAHLRQSIEDILTTRIGTRVERRSYGTALTDLIDEPINQALKVRAFSAIAQSLRRWEPRLALRRIRFVEAGPGYVTFDFDAVYLPVGDEIRFERVVISA